MKKLFPFFFLFNLLSSLPGLIRSQSLTESWAKTITGSKQTLVAWSQTAVDHNGNIYALSHVRGLANVGGQVSTDTTVHIVLSSWTCDGSFRWMKTFGTATPAPSSNALVGMQLETDSLDGIYVFGYFETSQSADSFYWSTDTSLKIAAGIHQKYILKYDTLGQFQWLKTPLIKALPYVNNQYNSLSVSPSGKIFWFSMLDTGSYAGGNLSVTAPAYYAVNYNAAGNFQSATVMDMTAPSPSWFSKSVRWEFDPVNDRFYGWLQLDTSYGPLSIGNAAINPPSGNNYKSVLAAFSNQGQKIWIRESDSLNALVSLIPGNDGNLFLLGSTTPGAIFCGDTAKNLMGSFPTDYLMSLDTNGLFRWSRYATTAFSTAGGSSSFVLKGNHLVLAALYNGSLGWGAYSVSNTTQYNKAYLLSVDAATGNIHQLLSFGASLITNPTKLTMDKNGNVYIGAIYQGSMSFGGTALPTTTLGDYQQVLLKYQNVPCNCNLLQPAFTANSLGSKTFQYSYTGNGPYSTISWNFGDGTPSVNAANPTHTFSSYGVYTVCVTTTNACGSNTACKTLYVTPTGIEDINQGSAFVIYPNPASDKLSIKGNLPDAQLEIIDVAGRRLQQQRLNADQTTIDIGNWAPGMYYIRVIQKDGKINSHSFMKR